MPRILIVDDEPVIVSVLTKILAAPEREFVTAETAGSAVQKAKQFTSIEVALLDKNLPDRTGLDLARELKHLHADIEVILMTGYASLDSAIEAIKVGAFDYVSKPIEDFDELNVKVQNAAEKVRLKREQRRLLDRFSENEERYRGAFHACSDAILLADVETGAIQDANVAAQRLYGYDHGELCQLKIGDLRVPGTAPFPDTGVAGERFGDGHMKRDGSRLEVDVSTGRFVYRKRETRVLVVREPPKPQLTR